MVRRGLHHNGSQRAGRNHNPREHDIYQPLSPHAAGQVHDNVGVIAYADAARVAICDGRVRPDILIGGALSQPVLRPVFASGDVPAPLPGQPGEVIWISAGRSGVTFSVEVVRYGRVQYGPFWELRNQLIARVRHVVPIPGDSGSPAWDPVWVGGVSGAKIHGLLGARSRCLRYVSISPVSGVQREFPGWGVWEK